MKCQSELQARANTGCKSAGRAKRSFLLIARILPAVQPLCNRQADWEQTDKTVCMDDPTRALMTCLVPCVRSGDTSRMAKNRLQKCSLSNKCVCVDVCARETTAMMRRSDGYSRICLPKVWGVWKAIESVCVWEIIGLSPRHSTFHWHTAGTQLAIQLFCPSPLFFFPFCAPPTTPPPPSTPPTECQTRRVREYGGRGLRQKKALALMGSRAGEEEGGSYDGAQYSQDPSGAWQEGIRQWQTGVPQQPC